MALEVDAEPVLIFTAENDIPCGRELFYDYNDRRAIVVKDFPWLGKDDVKSFEGKDYLNIF